MIARVTIIGANRQFDQPFDYRVPPDLEAGIEPGQIVTVPFGRRRAPAKGYVVSVSHKAASSELKTIQAILTGRPVVTAEHLRLAVEMRKRYFCSFSQALDCMVPPRISLVGQKTERAARLVDPDDVMDRLEFGQFRSQGHIRVAELLLQQPLLPLAELKAAAEVSDSVLRTLAKNKVIEIVVQDTVRDRDVPDDVLPYEAPPLRPAQQAALRAIRDAVMTPANGVLREFLLHGITGSGKTEVYLQLADRVLADGKSVIILVPEIALTPQMERRIRGRFGLDVAILHSRLTLTERYETWQQISRGDAHIVVGARSAIFAPLTNIGLIVLDEEHESTYKSSLKPRYHAADIARLRCLLHDAVLLLGSATPSLESYKRTVDGRSVLLSLPERIGQAGRPRMHLIDMKAVPKGGAAAIISEPLQHAIRAALERSEQVMILNNRRGHDRLTICRACGQAVTCGSCEVALIRHVNIHSKTRDKRLLCHHCDRIYPLPDVCPACGEAALEQMGYGTQLVEETVRSLFPETGIVRMDQDTTYGRGSHKTVLAEFADGRARILIGTQMIAKGHDFPNTTVVGILSADQLLNGDDFRQTERGFALMLQASGRAGRGERPGDVFIQAYNTEDKTLADVLAHDTKRFMRREAAYRKRLQYPPFGHIGMVLFSGFGESETKKAADYFQRLLLEARVRFPEYGDLQVLPVAPAPFRKLRNRYRYRLIVKGQDARRMTAWLAMVDDTAPRGSVSRALDLDPQSML